MNKEMVGSFAWAGAIIILALGMTLARKLGYVDGDTVTRVVVAANGLMIAWYGNRMPKTVFPSVCANRARRVSGWSMVLSGIVYTALWAFAPIPVALIGGCGAVIVGIAVTIGYCMALRDRARAA